MLGAMGVEAGQQRRGNAMVDCKTFRLQLSARAAHAGQHQVQPLAVITTTGDLLGRLDKQNAMRLRAGHAQRADAPIELIAEDPHSRSGRHAVKAPS